MASGLKKIGIMGGSFDPPHKTHIAAAERAREFLDLDEIFFVPAYSAPLKASPHEAPFEHRLKMLEIALKNFPGKYRIFDVEFKRGGASYSVDTARFFADMFKGGEFFWIIGADQLLQLDKWREIESLSKIVKFACLKRAGFNFAPPDGLPKSVRILEVPFAETPDSSTSARLTIKNGAKNLDFIDEGVLNYIRENKLYS